MLDFVGPLFKLGLHFQISALRDILIHIRSLILGLACALNLDPVDLQFVIIYFLVLELQFLGVLIAVQICSVELRNFFFQKFLLNLVLLLLLLDQFSYVVVIYDLQLFGVRLGRLLMIQQPVFEHIGL